MKKIFSVLALIIATNGWAQNERFADTMTTLSMKDNKVFYEYVYQIDSISKNELYVRAKNVYLRLFPATKDVIQNEDKENGIIAGKGNTSFIEPGRFGLNLEQKIRFTLSITVKDYKYRVQLFDIYYTSSVAGPIDNPIEISYLKDYKKNQNKFTKTLYRNMNLKLLSTIDQVSNEMNKKTNNDF